MIVRYFKGCKDLTECKVKYRTLAKELHPDVSEDKSGLKFKEMKNEYDSINKNPSLLIEKQSFNYTGQKVYWEDIKPKEKQKKPPVYKKQVVSLKDKIDDLLKIQKERDYRGFWVYAKFVDYCKENKSEPSLKAFEYIAEALGYKPMWAKIKHQEFYQ